VVRVVREPPQEQPPCRRQPRGIAADEGVTGVQGADVRPRRGPAAR